MTKFPEPQGKFAAGAAAGAIGCDRIAIGERAATKRFLQNLMQTQRGKKDISSSQIPEKKKEKRKIPQMAV
jgi:hypothetical protein